MSGLSRGVSRGLIELRQNFTGRDLLGELFWPVVTLVAIFFLRDRTVGGFTLGALILPGVLGMFVAFGMLLTVQGLAIDREDGTLLRAKATPYGIRAYFIGKLVTVSGAVLAYLVILLVPGSLLVGGLDVHVVTFAWVLLLGLVATQSIGAVLGALISTARGAGIMSLPVMGLISISGIFYPITSMPGWAQWTAQVFPVYWLGLGMRAALLPDAVAAVEIAGSWRLMEAFAVLGAWAVAGLIVAPVVLRRTTRRESGAYLAERREKALRRVA